MSKSITQQLKDRGFDSTEYDRATRTWAVKCSQCVACCIQFRYCHEHGCPNKQKAGL